MYKISDVFYENIYNIFLEYCKKNNMHYMTDLDGFDFNLLRDVKGIGVSKISSIEKKYKKYLSSNFDENIFSDIHPNNLNLSVETLSLFKVSKNIISSLNSMGIVLIKDLVDYGNSNLYKINTNSYKKITEALANYKNPVCDIIPDILNDFKKDENFDVVLLRSMGITLNTIGNELNVTRERVRQIEAAKLKRLKNILDIVLDDMVRRFEYKSCINLNKLELYFPDNDDLTLMKYSLYALYKDFYLEFCNKLLINGETREIVLERLNGITDYYIKDMVHFTGNMVVITESLSKNNIPYIDIEDLTNYLLLNGYIRKGNYIFKSGISYGLLCALVIKTHFKNGIKIHDDEELSKLREVVREEFDGLELPDNNRALGTRISCFLVLCDRGCYTVDSNIKIPPELLNEIYEYIEDYPESTMFFNDIFVHFKDKLFENSNITNRYFLQGVLKYYFEYDFIFERDSLTKKGYERKNIRELISDFIKMLGRPVHRREIKEHFPGATDVVITNSQISNPGILQWEYNYYIHTDNLNIDKKDILDIEKSLTGIFDVFSGYASEQLLYEAMLDKNKDFFEKNHIRNASNLFYLASYCLKNKYSFKRPHILKNEDVKGDISSKHIIEKFLMKDGVLKYTAYQDFVSKVKWSIGATYAVFKELEKDIVRISENEYIMKDKFVLGETLKKDIFEFIKKYIDNNEYLSVSRFSKYDELPEIGFSWNPFILSSVVQLYLPETMKIIVPQVEDRRYVKEIIVSSDFECDTYEQLIIYVIKKNNLNGSTLYHLELDLSSKGLIGRYLPKELYNSKNIYIENDKFYAI